MEASSGAAGALDVAIRKDRGGEGLDEQDDGPDRSEAGVRGDAAR